MVWSWRFLVAELDGKVLVCGWIVALLENRHTPLFAGRYRMIDVPVTCEVLQSAFSDVALGWSEPVGDVDARIDRLLNEVYGVKNRVELDRFAKVVEIGRSYVAYEFSASISVEGKWVPFVGEWGGDWGELAPEVVSAFGRSKRPGLRTKRVVPKTDYPVPFGEGAVWFAVRSAETKAVARLCGMVRAEKCSWADGLAVVESDGAWMSPPLAEGWIFVRSNVFREIVGYDDEDELVRVLKRISRKLKTDVQFFVADALDSPDRGEGSICAWASSGKLVRLIGGFGVCYGKPTPTENQTGLTSEDDPLSPDLIFELAAGWSLDPRSLDPKTAVGLGICTYEIVVPTS